MCNLPNSKSQTCSAEHSAASRVSRCNGGPDIGRRKKRWGFFPGNEVEDENFKIEVSTGKKDASSKEAIHLFLERSTIQKRRTF